MKTIACVQNLSAFVLDFHERPTHSSRNASTGSNRAALQAGAAVATNATTNIIAQATATTTGSNARTP